MHSITKEDAESITCRAVGSRVQVLNYNLEPFTRTKNGIFGSHTLLSVKAEISSSENDHVNVSTHTFFVKTPPESSVQDLLVDDGVFEEEVNFQKDIVPLLIADYNGEKWYPKCYLAKEGVLVYEDLRVQGFSSPTEVLMDKTSLKLVLATVARFHASSLLAEANLGKSLQKAYPKYFAEKMYCDNSKYGRITKIGYDTLILMVERMCLESCPALPHLYNYVCNKVKPKEGEVNVVCHSDLWKNNIMFDSTGGCIMVDYQFLRYASPAVDVAMLLYLNTTPDFRKTSEMEMYKHYYAVFQETLQKSKRDVQIPSFDYMLKEYMKHRIVGMTYAALYMPGIYLTDFAKVLNDPQTLEKYFFESRIDVISDEIDSNPKYLNQMKEILVELLEEARQISDWQA